MSQKLSLLFAIFVFTSTHTALAVDFDFSGTFAADNDVALFNFTVGAPSTITLFSSSWIEGDPPHGFDPMLGVWDAAGVLVDFQDDGSNVGTTFSNGVPYQHGLWDSFFDVVLDPGTYTASITQYDNSNVGSNLADGFVHDGNPNFTFDSGFGGATQPFFNGVWDDEDGRTADWEFHILNVEQASQVPEPGTLLLLGSGLMLVEFVRRRMRNL